MTSPGENAVVLVTDHPASQIEIETEILAQAGARLVVAESGTEDELLRIAPTADAILTCFAMVSPDVVSAAKRLQVIGRYGVGVDNIAVAAATEQDVIVANVPDYCTNEVAEHTMALLLTLARRIVKYDRSVRSGDWALSSGTPIHRIAGRTLGIIGLGRIGQAVATRAHALDLKLVAVDRGEPHYPVLATIPIEYVSLDELLRRADYVTIHVPLTPDTDNLIDETRLSCMKPGAVLINTSRGAVVDLAALEWALRSGVIAGAALDVFQPERLPMDHPLWTIESVVATPHVGFYSEESIRDLVTRAARNVADVLSGHAPVHVVNHEVLARPRWAGLKPPRVFQFQCD